MYFLSLFLRFQMLRVNTKFFQGVFRNIQTRPKPILHYLIRTGLSVRLNSTRHDAHGFGFSAVGHHPSNSNSSAAATGGKPARTRNRGRRKCPVAMATRRRLSLSDDPKVFLGFVFFLSRLGSGRTLPSSAAPLLGLVSNTFRPAAMEVENNVMLGGWPLGLESMNLRLQGAYSSQAASTGLSSSNFESDSSSSYTSSELDSLSTRSFFRDSSVTLGRLIGIYPDNGDLFFADAPLSEELIVTMANAPCNVTKRQAVSLSWCKCVPLISDVLVKINPARLRSR